MLRSEQIFKKCTIYVNFRTIIQEEKKKLDKWLYFFCLLFELCLWYHFCIGKFSKIIFMGGTFGPFWCAKNMNFGGESFEIRVLSCSIQEIYKLRKVKNQVLFFLSSWAPNLSDLMVYHIFEISLLLVNLTRLNEKVEDGMIMMSLNSLYRLQTVMFGITQKRPWIKISKLT